MTYGYQHPLEDEKCGDCWTREEGEFCFDGFVWKISCGGFAIDVCELILGSMCRVRGVVLERKNTPIVTPCARFDYE